MIYHSNDGDMKNHSPYKNPFDDPLEDVKTSLWEVGKLTIKMALIGSFIMALFILVAKA